MPPTLDSTGLTIESLAEIRAAMNVAFRAAFGSGALLGDDTDEGKIIGIVSERAALIQQLAQAIYDAFDPTSASGVSLERIAAITSVTRNPATPSTVNLYLVGTPSTAIPLGTLAAVEDAGDQFQTLAAAVLGAVGNMTVEDGTADIAITSINRVGTVATVTTTAPHGLPAGAVVTISGATGGDAALYNVTAEIENIGASTFDYNMTGTPGGAAAGTQVYIDNGLAADHITFADIAVRSVAHGLSTDDWAFISAADQATYNVLAQVTVLDVDHFTYSPAVAVTVTPATGSYTADEATEIAAESVETGAVQGLANTITTIVNAISGWDRVENFVDATLGLAEETDAALRTRRETALSGLGNATLEAIRADLLLVTSVTEALVFENDTDAAVGSRPPHSVEAVVEGGAVGAKATALFNSKAAGIATHGTEFPITSITRVATLASVTTTSPHGLSSGDLVKIGGATGADAGLYNITAAIANVGGSTFDYTMGGTPDGAASGTLVYQEVERVTDSQGTTHDVLLTRPTERDIWLEIDFTTDANFPADGLDQAETAILAYGNALGIGDDVIVFPTLVAAVSDIPGIIDMVIRIDDTASGGGDPGPSADDNIVIAETAVSVWSSSRLTFIEL